MLQKFNLKKIFCVLAIASAVFIESCKSVPDNPEVDPLALLDTDAAMYIYIPAAQNAPFLTSAFSKAANISESDAEKLVSRTKVLACAAGISGNRTELSALGNYPVKYLKYAVNENNGWSEQSMLFAERAYALYQNERKNIQLSLPSSKNAVLSPSVLNMLNKYDFNAFAASSPAAGSIPAGFDEAVYAQLTGGTKGEINFYSEKPALFISSFLGKNVDIGITKISGYLLPSKNGKEYGVTVKLELADPRTIKAASVLLKKAMFPVAAKIMQSSSNSLTVTDITVSWNTLINLMGIK